MKSNEIELYKESWHNVYPNKKRKRLKTVNSKRYLFYLLLDRLLELGYEEKVYITSSMFNDLIINSSPLYYGKGNTIYINYIYERQSFIIKENEIENQGKAEYTNLSLEETVDKIINITNNWNNQSP
jgi:hypothetical protein